MYIDQPCNTLTMSKPHFDTSGTTEACSAIRMAGVQRIFFSLPTTTSTSTTSSTSTTTSTITTSSTSNTTTTTTTPLPTGYLYEYS